LLKGCKTIADILNPLLSRNPGLYFVFVGAVENYLDKSMMEYVWERAGSTRNRVLYLKPIHHEALYPIIENSLGVILPSRIDNFPNTCLEAMYFGQIVVGTRGASFEPLIDDRSSGFLCMPDDPQSLLHTIQRALYLTKEERATISENAKSRILNLSPEKTATTLIKFYEHVLRSSS